MKYFYLFFALIITACAEKEARSNPVIASEQITNNAETDAIEERGYVLSHDDFVGLWRNTYGGLREISTENIRGGGYGFSFTWNIDSVVAVENTDEATKREYPNGFTFSGKITDITTASWTSINLGFGSGNGLGEHYSGTFYLHTDKDSILNVSENAKTFYSKSDRGEERFVRSGFDLGTAYATVITADNVKIHSQPSENSSVRFEVNRGTRVRIISTSPHIDTIDGYTGNWLQVAGDFPLGDGWVFSNYVERGQVTPSTLQIIELPPKEENRGQILIASYQVDGAETMVNLYPKKIADQPFYTFVFDEWVSKNIDGRTIGLFHYSNIRGSYAWFPETNELRHISFIGTTAESAWVIFTDDFRYLMEDYGTSPGPRGLVVYRVEDGEVIYNGSYLNDINLRGHTIEVISSLPRDSDEIVAFMNNNSAPDEMVNDANKWGLGMELVLLSELDLDTGIERFITGKWIMTQ
jgi:hypothetical protein